MVILCRGGLEHVAFDLNRNPLPLAFGSNAERDATASD
jgi:hypothetical protein